MKLGFSRQIFEKSINIKFHENPLSGSRFGPDITKLIVHFSHFAKAPKNGPTPYTVHRQISKITIRPLRTWNRVPLKTHQLFGSPRQSLPSKKAQISFLCKYKHETGPVRNQLNTDIRFTVITDLSYCITLSVITFSCELRLFRPLA